MHRTIRYISSPPLRKGLVSPPSHWSSGSSYRKAVTSQNRVANSGSLRRFSAFSPHPDGHGLKSNSDGERSSAVDTVYSSASEVKDPAIVLNDTFSISGASSFVESSAATDLAQPHTGSASGLNSSISPIPTLPPPVSGYPTPWVTEEEFSKYVMPLYSHRWAVLYSKRGVRHSKTKGTIPHVVKIFQFRSFEDSVAFINDVAELARTENHHPSVTLENMGTHTVMIHIHTDSALRPEWSPRELRSERKVPGLTLRDVRLAILIETCYASSHFTPDFAGKDISDEEQLLIRQPDWQAFIKAAKHNLKISGQRLCPACKGPHSLIYCPDRHGMPPSQPCIICGGEHWKIDCPKTQNKSQKSCPACGGPHGIRWCPTRKETAPNQPCTKCGGNHWKVDCPSTQMKRFAKLPQPTKLRETTWTPVTDRSPPRTPCPLCGGNHWKVECRNPHIPKQVAESLKLPLPGTSDST